ncbi:MAG: penicillin-binding protein 2 [Bacteroidetes bacterium]|nr:MAG: penicillin-binding protein 2 [Bacteroidota bacterium]
MEDYRIRVRFFIGIIAGVLVLLGLRLVQLQLVESQVYSGTSRDNAVREVRVQPARGVIYDRNGTLMVDNEPIYTVTVTPQYFEEDRIGLLADLLGVPDSVVVRKLRAARQWSAFRPSPLFQEVPFEVYSRLQENLYRLPGVSFEIRQKRRYQTAARAAHALGYIREISQRQLEAARSRGYRQGDLIGQTGLEKYYEDAMRGTMGSEFVLVNRFGREVMPFRNGLEDTPPLSGYDLYLTLDHRVQALAESLFVNKRGGAVAIDPQTGEILALVSKPDYDPDLFSRTVPPEVWTYLTSSPERPMFNRATMSGMPPGSTWKPFMALLALQEGLIRPTETVFCPGYHPLGRGRMFRCMHVHGAINVKQAIQHSCNTFFFEMMLRTDVNTFSDYAHRFGFGETAPTDLLEQAPGLIPDSAYFNRTYPRGWTVGYSINLGIGQGDMTVTPLQLANYVATIANGGTLHAPHLVRKLVRAETGEERRPDLPPPRPTGIRPEHFQLVREGMRLVMKQGTGAHLQIPNIPSGAKTGTAQNAGKDHSIFIMFAPFENPQIAIGIVVENAGFGGTAAGPIASFMAEQYLTGKIATTPQRRWLLNRTLNLRSDPIPGTEPSTDLAGD